MDHRPHGGLSVPFEAAWALRKAAAVAPATHNDRMLVTFEGPEGGGKSTALHLVADSLRTEGRVVVETREPGAGSFGAKIRGLLLEGDDLDHKAELMLFLADRAEHVARVVRPALERGETVLCDRFADSTVVYQGYARGLPIEEIRAWNSFVTGGLRPELTLLFDLAPSIGLARIAAKNRLDSQALSFHEKVRAGFLVEASRDPGRWRILDAASSPQAVLAEALRHIRSLSDR